MRIRKNFVVALLLIGVAMPAGAEVGKLFRDYTAEYGDPVEIPNAQNMPELMRGAEIVGFQKDDWDIRVLFINKWSKAVLYKKRKKDKDGLPERLTEAEIEWLLKHSGGNKRWVKNSRNARVGNVPIDGKDPYLLEWLDEPVPRDNRWVSSADIVAYSTEPKSLKAVTNHRTLEVSNDAAKDAFKEGRIVNLTEALNPPAQKKKAAVSKERIEQEREWVAKYMVEAEARAKRLYTEYSAIMGRDRGIKKALDYLENWDGVIEAKVDGEYIRIKYKGDMTGSVHIGPEEK